LSLFDRKVGQGLFVFLVVGGCRGRKAKRYISPMDSLGFSLYPKNRITAGKMAVKKRLLSACISPKLSNIHSECGSIGFS
jgi:hypothetical protein